MTLAQAANLLGISSTDPDVVFKGFSIDSRSLQAGNLFIAINGERVNGHDFIAEAAKRGAAAALVAYPVRSELPLLLAPQVETALGLIAKYWRDQFSLPIIAVTGSNGKTTLKNMIAAIMLAACNSNENEVLATQGNRNNHLGLPLTLARLNAAHRYAVIEMGMNHFGEIDYLTKLTHPTVAVITNAASAHLEGVGSVAGVARAKAEIFAGLADTGTAILNRDDAFYSYWLDIIKNKKLKHFTFGFHPDADIKTTEAQGMSAAPIKVETPRGCMTINMPLLGKHNVLNALAAIAATVAIDIPLVAIQSGLEQIQAAPGRLQLHTLKNGVKIIDDTYNANPFSLQAAINTLAAFAGKKILVLGDMKELGSDAKSLHQTAGEQMRLAGIDYLFTYGELSALTTAAFGKGAYHFHEQTKLLDALKPYLADQATTILIKGSRSMHMEKVVTGLVS